MAEEPTRRRPGKREAAATVAEDAPKQAPEPDVSDEEEATEAARPPHERSDTGGAPRSMREELRSIVRDAALEVLGPVAKDATTAAARYAVKRAPQLAKDTVAPRLKEAGGAGELAKGAVSRVSDAGGGVLSKVGVGRGDGGGQSGTGKGRRLPVQESVDVAVPVETAYDQFTQFEDFPEFMHRVERVEQRDDTHLVWHENIWGVRRQWEAEIVDQAPDERIVWESVSGPQTTGVVTFHRLSDRLTRIEVNLDFQPQGLFEKLASGTRISRRALKSDLMRFKAFIEMRPQETGAWRGQVVEGEVVEEPAGEREREEREAEEPEEREQPEEPQAERREEPEAEPEEPEAERREEPEAEPEEPQAEEVEAPVATEPAAEEPDEEPEEPEQPEAEQEPDEEPSERPRRVRRRPPARPARPARERR